MSTLYTSLASIYEAMYQSFIDYQEEYAFYSQLLLQYKKQSVLEIGCGSGNLARSFIENNFHYTGLDLSDDMLAIAKKNNPSASFMQGYMQNFSLKAKVDACIITGRTISYLVSNKDVLDTFHTIHQHLNPSGIICFDFIDANKFIPLIHPQKEVIHKANFQDKSYQRKSLWNPHIKDSFSFNWASVYFEEDAHGDWQKIGEDTSIIRTFTKDEMIVFLTLAGFVVKQIIERPSYAFDTFVIVAEKNNV